VQSVTREIFDDAIGELLKNEVIVRTGDKIRLLKPLPTQQQKAGNEENVPPAQMDM
jgi:hypothetical protein